MVCPEQAEEHLAPYPFLDAADNRRSVARWWDADHGAVRPVLMTDMAGAILEGLLRALRAGDAGIWVDREPHPADGRQGYLVAWAGNLEPPPAWADGSVEAAGPLCAAPEAPDIPDAGRFAA